MPAMTTAVTVTRGPARAIALALVLLAGSESALAQNALGSGNALDANLRVGDKRNARGRDVRQELAFRNAIVTGNAGAGLSFRGDIGYRASDDFRSTTGSDNLFDFRRDSDYSGLATLNIRGITPVQEQFSLATGGQTRGMVAGDLIVNRSQIGASGSQFANSAPNDSKFDPFARFGGTLRSPSTGLIREASRPSILALDTAQREDEQTEAGRRLLVASPLQGVRSLAEINSAFGYKPREITGYKTPQELAAEESKKLTELEGDRAPTDIPGYVSPFDSFRKQLADSRSGRIDTSIDSSRRPTELTPEERERTGLPDPAKGRPEAAGDTPEKPVDSFETQLERLRDVLSGKAGEKAAEGKAKGEDATPQAQPVSPAEPVIPGVTPDPNAKPRPSPLDPLGRPRIPGENPTDPMTLALEAAEKAKALLTEPKVISALAPTEADNQIFKDHMTKGQELLAEGRWFDAEERFASALALREGDPMAAAGRVHAQIAAGMYLSAALNLRNTFRAYPELIAAKYAPELLPRGQRLDTVRAQLRARAKLDTLIARDAGLLLMYLGQQTGNAQDLTDGAAIIDRVNEAMKIEVDPLDAALRAAWTGK